MAVKSSLERVEFLGTDNLSREDGSGARHLFDERVMDEDPVSLTAVVMPTSRDVVAYRSFWEVSQS